MTHSLLRAAWVGEDLLLLAAAPAAEPAHPAVDSRPASFAGHVVSGGRAGGEAVLVARVPVTLLDDPTARFAVLAADVGVAASASDLRHAVTDLRTFLRDQVALWDAEGRAGVVAMLASLSADAAVPPSLAEGLHTVRDALRERQSLAVVDERVDRAVHVERLHRIDDNAFYATGWVWEQSARTTALTAVSPEGERLELLDVAFRHSRNDVADRFGAAPGRRAQEPSGFVCHFTTTTPSVLPDGWVFETANDAGRGVETHAALTTVDPAAARAAIVADMGRELPGADGLREGHLRPALARLQELRRDAAGIVTEESLGARPQAPEVSIVVPLFERVDLLEHQLAQFADDPAMRECELIYVLDSPEQRDHVRAFAAELFRLYSLPFRVVTLAANGGVAIARNAGAAVASGRRLLFLDSDVLPAGPGWLPRLVDLFAAGRHIGALTAKLLYEDQTVQHAGFAFDRAAGECEWEAEHRFKGMHRNTPAANAPGPVAALSGACLLLDAERYHELGGMSWQFVQGDYEDVDLCMRLAAVGCESWYAPEVELYHLEGQSYVAESRAENRRYNRWLHTQLWGERIERLA